MMARRSRAAPSAISSPRPRAMASRLLSITDTQRREDILELVLAGNRAQLDDGAFRSELKSWLRFNPGAAARTRDGLLSAASGNPSLPDWLGPLMYDLTVKADGDNDKVAAQMRSSSGLVVFSAATDDPAGWVAAGRAYERFALAATRAGPAACLRQPGGRSRHPAARSCSPIWALARAAPT